MLRGCRDTSGAAIGRPSRRHRLQYSSGSQQTNLTAQALGIQQSLLVQHLQASKLSVAHRRIMAHLRRLSDGRRLWSMTSWSGRELGLL